MCLGYEVGGKIVLKLVLGGFKFLKYFLEIESSVGILVILGVFNL